MDQKPFRQRTIDEFLDDLGSSAPAPGGGADLRVVACTPDQSRCVMRVLLVEHESEEAQRMAQGLNEAGYSVEVAANGMAAQRFVEQCVNYRNSARRET